MGRPRPRIHLTCVGSTATDAVEQLGGLKSTLALAARGAGSGYRITANERFLLARQNEHRGGRFDDAARIREICTLLADDTLAAVVTIRGGSWFTRLLDRIDFDVLRRRKTTLFLFGFSEMTPLIAIAGRYRRVVGLYDMGPAFLSAGMKRYALKNVRRLARGTGLGDTPELREAFATGWSSARFPDAFGDFFGEVVDIIEGRGSPRAPTGRLLAGALPASKKISITGGNLSLTLPLIGSRYARAVDPRGQWLAMEEIGESPGQIDRMMAGLKLAGWFERAEGILLGDFHDDQEELSDAAFEILKRHLPPRRRVPVVALENVGHVWPMAPLPLHREVTLRSRRSGRGKPRVTIEIPWAEWARR